MIQSEHIKDVIDIITKKFTHYTVKVFNNCTYVCFTWSGLVGTTGYENNWIDYDSKENRVRICHSSEICNLILQYFKEHFPLNNSII